MGSVNGKVALITGGARGVGAEVARRLLDRGANLVLTDVDETALTDIGAELGEDRVLTSRTSVTSPPCRTWCRVPPKDSAASTS
jgi:NAD(P)-dependent dehydrogenase (short-subunit alcohol dehydrogenase family)